MFKTKKGVTELIPVGLGIGVFAIVLSVVALILSEFESQMVANSLADNITKKGLDALWTIAKFLGIIALALIGGFLIYVLVKQFSGSAGGTA
jgi:hypothetical protein